MKYKDITDLAKEVKAYVEKHGELPDKAKGLTTPQYSYILTMSVINPNKDIEKLSFKPAPNPSGDSISKTLTKKEYTDIAKDINKFINANSRLPNYVKHQSKKLNIDLCTYCFAKTVKFTSENGRQPTTCEFNSKVFKQATPKKKKYGHATRHGCDNMGQNTPYFCGCHSLQEIIRNLTGKVIPQSTIASICGTTTSGTDHNGLNTFVAWFNRKYGFNLKVEWKNFSDLGWKGIRQIVESDNKDCLIHNRYRNKYGHYEVVNAVSDSNIKVQNSLGDKCTSSCYCGYVENRTPAEYRSYINGISQKSIMVVTK